MKTFKHSGALGDIIYSLPVIKKLGGGILYLDTTGGISDPYCQNQILDKSTKFTIEGYNFLYPLLKSQSYITDVLPWNNENVDFNLNKFRSMYGNSKRENQTNNIVGLHLEAFDLPDIEDDETWIECEQKTVLDKKIVICRSPRMQSNYPWFFSKKHLFRDSAIFIGLKREHELFEWTFDINIEYKQTNTALDLCKIIKGSELFVANSTFALSVAVGLGSVQIIQELEKHEPTTFFKNRKNMTYV